MLINENPINGSKYTRAFRVEFDNPLDGIPSCAFHQEDVIIIDSNTKIKLANYSSVRGNLNDPESTFELLNPETLEPLGATATYTELAVMLTSLYVHLHNIQANSQPVVMPASPEVIVEPAPTVDANTTVIDANSAPIDANTTVIDANSAPINANT